jgi:predicted metal-dependent hydrolase
MTESLSEIHVKNDIKPILARELDFFNAFNIDEKLKRMVPKKIKTASIQDYVNTKLTALIEKMTEFVEQLSKIVAFKNNIRFRNVPMKQLLLKYMQELIFFGAIDMLLDSDDTAVLMEAIMFHVEKYSREKLTFDPKELKTRIEAINEKEKSNIIKELDNLKKSNEDLFTIEKMKKRLGIGKWAVGGTKVIYAYDKDYYDLERQKRLDAGIMDFPGLGNDPFPQAQEVDQLGFAMGGEEEGYDHAEDFGED